MEDNSCEPWNNGYQLAGDVADLLRRLRREAMTEEEVAYFFARSTELVALLPLEERERAQGEILSGLAGFLASGGTSPALGDAVERGDARLRSRVGWGDLPAETQAVCRRRAACVLEAARRDGYAEADARWRITPAGERYLDQGEPYMK